MARKWGPCVDMRVYSDSVSLQRLDAARSRIESLNPLVTVDTITNTSVHDDNFKDIIASVDLVCVTDLDRDTLVCLH